MANIMKTKDKNNEIIGMERFRKGVNQPKKHTGIPNIKTLQRNVLQCIVGQDEAVRRIITGVYRAIYLRTIKTNLLVIGKSGTGKNREFKTNSCKIRYSIYY